jgi:hypothetical protein
MKETINRIRKFRNDRDWSQFHTPANLSKAISIEAGELLEEFLWDEENYAPIKRVAMPQYGTFHNYN